MHHETNWPFIVLAIVFVLLRFIGSAVGKATKNNDTSKQQTSPRVPPPLPRSSQGDLDTERVRKFLEALGQAPGTTPPPPVRPRTDVPARPLAPVQPPRALVPAFSKSAKAPAQPPPDSTGRGGEPARPVLHEHVRSLRSPARPALASEPIAVSQRDAVSTPRRPSAPLEPYRAAAAYGASGDTASSIQNLLRSPRNLRAAIILREVLAPPRSLQPIGLEPTADA
jgi:hypothetical protein